MDPKFQQTMNHPTKSTMGCPEAQRRIKLYRPSLRASQHATLKVDDLVNQTQNKNLGATPATSLLLRLPLELREPIYHYAILNHLEWLEDHEPETITPTGMPAVKNEAQLYPPLLRADVIYMEEAEPILLSNFSFHFTDLNLLRDIPAENRMLIKHMGIKISGPTYGFDEHFRPPANWRPRPGWTTNMTINIQTFTSLVPNLEHLDLQIHLNPEITCFIAYRDPQDELPDLLAQLRGLWKTKVWIDVEERGISLVTDHLVCDIAARFEDWEDGLEVSPWCV